MVNSVEEQPKSKRIINHLRLGIFQLSEEGIKCRKLTDKGIEELSNEQLNQQDFMKLRDRTFLKKLPKCQYCTEEQICELRDTVYLITCEGCGEKYVGETLRPPRRRLDEHRRALTNPSSYASESFSKHRTLKHTYERAPMLKVTVLHRHLVNTLEKKNYGGRRNKEAQSRDKQQRGIARSVKTCYITGSINASLISCGDVVVSFCIQHLRDSNGLLTLRSEEGVKCRKLTNKGIEELLTEQLNQQDFMKIRDRTILKIFSVKWHSAQSFIGRIRELQRFQNSHQISIHYSLLRSRSRKPAKYVIPFCLGPIGGRYSINAVQLTDSAFVVLNMRVITRVSSAIWDAIGQADFVRCIHSVGRPRPITARLKSNWMCNTDQYFLAQRLAENDVSVLDSCCIYS
ncbi:hypothetical protein Y032_0862g2742 [Ancylostoma ceylanicum]|uniref:Phosphoenolpyruvate carboxykinase GTP-utilising N-terminal domain-containing protein n=1 Tax=Ancylostoma ceylanicum TaxID=53326 RepID=A0A016WAV0_9BILA|nr:hypothetical protein Y032_0862g2742 [Ancylostoma ceylanicum]